MVSKITPAESDSDSEKEDFILIDTPRAQEEQPTGSGAASSEIKQNKTQITHPDSQPALQISAPTVSAEVSSSPESALQTSSLVPNAETSLSQAVAPSPSKMTDNQATADENHQIPEPSCFSSLEKIACRFSDHFAAFWQEQTRNLQGRKNTNHTEPASRRVLPTPAPR